MGRASRARRQANQARTGVVHRTPRASVSEMDDLVGSVRRYVDADIAWRMSELTRLSAKRREVERGIAQTVGLARARGHSWTTIGAALDVSAQAAQKRYAGNAETHKAFLAGSPSETSPPDLSSG